MHLESDRLILDPWRAGEWAALRPLATDAEVMRYITGGTPWSDEQIRGFIERQIGMYAERGFCRWKLTDKASGDVIGFCGAGQWRDEPDPEIGWWLARRYWGQGLATEAGRVALRDARDRAGIHRLISIARPENSASTRVMSKLGLELECEFESDGIRLVRYATRA